MEAKTHTKKLASQDKRLFSGQGDIEVWHKGKVNIGIQCSFLKILSLIV